LCFKVQPQEIFTSVFLHARIQPALDEHLIFSPRASNLRDIHIEA
jgi:hypothetical protein